MTNNTALSLFFLTATCLVVGAVVYYQPPTLQILNTDYLKKEGTFRFAGVDNTFDLKGAMEIAARNGYSLAVHSDGKSSVFFDLYQNGVYLHNLKTITFLSF